jgi:hypothetical protein
MAFFHWLEARLGGGIRLPTEFEWQLAATRGESGRVYPWGPDWDPQAEPWRANTAESGLNRSTAVGLYPLGASPTGVRDMAGTIYEWCLNAFEDPDDSGLPQAPGSGAPGRQRPAVLRRADRERVRHALAKAPTVRIADMGDPAADAGVQLGEADVPSVMGGEPGTQAPVGVAHLARLHQAMAGVDDETEPGDAGAHRQHLRPRLVDDQAQAGEAR